MCNRVSHVQLFTHSPPTPLQVAVVTRLWLTTFNSFEAHDEEGSLERLSRAVEDRAPGQALITVANHSTVLDDPALMAAVLPWRLVLNSAKHRWAVCTQEVCFRNDLFAAFVGCGKVLPIKRGAGVDQPQFLDLCRHVAAGNWVHLFPEGKVNQGDRIGANYIGVRDAEAAALCGGRLKWGIGKMVAHSPQAPVLIPFYAKGMRELLPCDPATGENERPTLARMTGKRVEFWAGREVKFDDLIRAHEIEHGPLWKYGSRPGEDSADWREHWPSSKEERALYSAITWRVEEEMIRLQSLDTEASTSE